MIKKVFYIRPLTSNNSCQLVVLMGFILVMSVVVLASFTSELSNIGTEVQSVHSEGKIPEFVNIIKKFKQSVQFGVNNDTNHDIPAAFNETTDFFYRCKIPTGTYFNACLANPPYYNGHSFIGTNGCAVYSLDADFTINDGNINITKSAIITILVYV